MNLFPVANMMLPIKFELSTSAFKITYLLEVLDVGTQCCGLTAEHG